MQPSEHEKENNTPHVPFFTRIIATGFYSGYSPFASGTAGSAVGVLLYCIPGMSQVIPLSIGIVLMFAIGTYASAVMEKQFGEDPSIVVVDEIVGMWISLLLLPKTWLVVLLAFLAFRFHDIVKIPPARQCERFPNGYGIMLDDVVAGIYANISVRIVMMVLPGWFA